MLKSLFLSSAAITLLAAPMAARAQSASDTTETIIDSATRIPTPASQIASSVTLITDDDIAAMQARTLPDVLRDVPGLNLTQTGGVGGQTSIFMRGSNSNHTKVLLDGIDISDPSNPNGSADVSKLLTGDIARVEVLRGPQSGLYGSDSIGGVINIITKSGEGAPSFRGSLEGGSFQTFNQQAGVSGADGAFHFVVSLDHDHAGATPVTPVNLLPRGGKRNDDYFDGLMASAKLGYDVTDNFDLGVVGHYNTSLAHITGDAFSLVTFADVPSSVQSRLDTLQYDTRGTAHLVTGNFDSTLGLAYSSTITSDKDPNNGYSLSAGNRVKLDYLGDWAFMNGETLLLGAESARDAMHVPVNASITTNAGFAELQSALGGFNDDANIRFDDNSRYGGKVTWRVAPSFVLDQTKFKASVGTGFKAPSLEQLFQSFASFGFLANPNLKPETSLGYEAGVEQGIGAFRGGVTAFRNDIRNLIADNATFTTNINIGKARTQGLESFIAWKALDTLSFRADYTYTDAIDEVARQELLRRPRNKISLNGNWQALTDLSFDATLLYVGPQIDGNRSFSIPRLKMPGYTTLNLAGSYRLSDQFTLFARVENATDTYYQSPDGFLQPGIGAYAGIKVNY